MINLFSLKSNNSKISGINNAIKKVIKNNNFIMGDEVRIFETKLKKKFKSKYVITCANGTDALTIALKALDLPKNSYICVTNFSYISTAEVILANGFKPYFIDINYDNFNINVNKLKQALKILPKNKVSAVISTDLFGYPAQHQEIIKLKKKYKFKYIIDGAQSLGSKVKGNYSCNFGDVYTTSFFPTKPLGCFGDGGAIFTRNDKISKKIISLKFHGKGKNKNDHIRIGLNSRLDTIQAAILIEKLKYFDEEKKKRNQIAKLYFKKIKNNKIILPNYKKNYSSIYSLFTIKTTERNRLIKYLNKNEIACGIYYDRPLTSQAVFLKYSNKNLQISDRISKQCLSIPCNSSLSNKDVFKIIDTINEFK